MNRKKSKVIEEVSSEKRVLKNEIKYKLTLSPEQKIAKATILDNKVTVLIGQAGVSKTFSAIATALDLLFKKEVNKIVMTRPLVALEDIGILPGSAEERLKYYFLPIMDNLHKLYDKAKIDKIVADKMIEILPVAFIQGITISDFLIVDEAENLSEFQTRMILTRLGKGGKIVFTGDVKQSALKQEKGSAFQKLIDLKGKINDFDVVELKTNYRDQFVQDILKLY